MKVYQIITKLYQDFSFYEKDGHIILCSDPKFPYISGNNMYDGISKKWIHINSPILSSSQLTICNSSNNINTYMHPPDKCVCPSWFVQEEYYIDHVKNQLDSLLDTAISAYGKEEFNIFIFKKYLKIKIENKKLLSIGMCARPNIRGKRCHNEFTKHCQKLLNLKAFW